LESESRVLEIGRTKLKPPTPEEPPKIKFVVLQKPRLEALSLHREELHNTHKIPQIKAVL
jgi:hypothetical protein